LKKYIKSIPIKGVTPAS